MIDRDAVIDRAQKKGVKQMIVSGASVEGSKEAVDLGKKYPKVLFATAGIHPHDAITFDDKAIEQLRQIAREKEVVAIGECGLDFNRMFSPQPVQEQAFEAQLNLAKELSMPLFLHEREAHVRFCEIFSNYIELAEHAVVHCFTGTVEEVKTYLSMGFSIGVTGWICDERRGHSLREAVKHIPLDRLLIETDAPYLLPRNLENKPKNRRNEPAFCHILFMISLNIWVFLPKKLPNIQQTTPAGYSAWLK